MTSFDLDKLLAAAGAEMQEEQKGKLLVAMNAVIEKVALDADEAAQEALQTQTETAAKAQTRNDQFEIRAQQLLDEVQKRQQDAVAKIADAAQEQATEINAVGQQIEAKVGNLETTRVLAELTWNDLPKKIAIGGAAFIGLLIGAVLTVLVAASERRDANIRAALAQGQVVELQQYVSHWRQTAGFELGQYRGDPVVRLDRGQEFVRFVPSVGAGTAGNLWKISSE